MAKQVNQSFGIWENKPSCDTPFNQNHLYIDIPNLSINENKTKKHLIYLINLCSVTSVYYYIKSFCFFPQTSAENFRDLSLVFLPQGGFPAKIYLHIQESFSTKLLTYLSAGKTYLSLHQGLWFLHPTLFCSV